MDRLDHENLDVYQRATEFLALAADILDTLPRGALANQLERAALSIPLNIAEGAGKTGPDDKIRFFAIARGSAMECGAILDACRVMKKIDSQKLDQGKHLLIRTVAMLTRLCRARARAR